MARSYLTNVNYNQNQIQNAVIQPLGTAPTSPVAGQIYYDSATANYTLQWNGSAWVNSLSRSFHTGTQLAATISNLATTVQGYSLSTFAVPTANIPMAGFTLSGLGTPTAAGQAATYDWTLGRSLSAFAVPTANLPMAGFTLTGLAAPTATGQAATWDYVNSAVQSAASGISSKDPVNAVATTNIATLSGTTTIDGVALAAGNRVLLTAQTTASQNGPWIIAAGSWTRPATEGGATAELDFGAMWLSLAGTAGAGTQWRLSAPTSGTVTVGTTAITIVQFGAGSSYTAGNGITLTGSAFSVNPVASGGVLVAAGGVSVDSTIVAKKFSQAIGDGSTLAYVVTHALGTQNVLMQVKQATTPFGVVECDMAATSTTTATFTFASAPTTGQYLVTVIG